MNFDDTYAAIYRKNFGLKAVVKDNIDFVDIDSLIGIESQKSALLENTQNFMHGMGANHALLWGERGCGKSSLVKAVFSKFHAQGLRLVEVSKDDLEAITSIIDVLREDSHKFIIFCDDFSFESGDTSYKFLKPLLEGSIEKAPTNVLLYATSNRRHLVSESASDNKGVSVGDGGELHFKDAVEEKMSLSDRFGLWISFYQGSKQNYLQIVDSYFPDFKGDKDELHLEAMRFAMSKASRSGRSAKQFYNYYKNRI